MKEVEILSPVGNLESFKSAINNGADAIYLGIAEFNARGNLANFSLDELKNIIREAHLFGVKVYLTLNILFMDSEIEKVLKMVDEILKMNIDAFIVQDIGLIYLLRTIYPNINLHASTQMGVENLEGVEFLKRLKFSRVVLARETPLSEIRRIKENSDIEIEYFVQGALCVSYSGNCYLCSLLADSSGNRGKCKQFCRLPYTLNSSKIEKEGYLLSAKDFCMLPRLKELKDAGVASFKIEGRARRASFIGEATYVYKNAVLNNFKYSEKDVENLKREFNRGNYIEGYFGDSKIIYDKVQNHIGVRIGKVEKVNFGKKFNEIFIKSKENINKNDGLKFFDEEKEVMSIGVNDIQKVGNLFKITTTSSIKKGWMVNKIVDSNLDKIVLNRRRVLPVDVKFVAKVNEKAKLMLSCCGVDVTVVSDDILCGAKNQPLTFSEAKTQVSKLGEEFSVNSFQADIDNVFMRKAELNELRRQGTYVLKEKIINAEKDVYLKNGQKTGKKLEIFDKKQEKMQIFASNSLKSLEKISNDNIKLVYKFENFDADEITKFCENHPEKILYIDMPVIVNHADYMVIKNLLDKIDNLGIVANNYYALSMTDKCKTIVGSNLNVYNSYAVKFYVDNGYKDIILTQEKIDYSKIKNCGANLYAFKENYPEYMYFKHCPAKEHLNGNCDNCLFEKGITYKLNKSSFSLVRRKILSCQFVLKDNEKKVYNIPENIGEIYEKKLEKI